MVVNELLNLGLSQKEAEVYLATLQLGMASVQKISRKAELNRTSCYTYIKNLINRGLISAIEKNGKQYFVAEKPEKLKYFCELQEQEILRRKQTIDKIMPELESLYKIASDRPSVKLFNHKEELPLLQKEILEKRADEILNIYNYHEFKDATNVQYVKNLLDSTKSFKAIYIADQKVIMPKLRFMLDEKKVQIRFLPRSKFDLVCEIVVASDLISISRQTDSLIITDSLFAQTFKLLFMALWEIAEDFKK